MEEIALTRYRDKNPAVRETTEAARVKGKVDKANNKKRRKRMHPNDPRLLRLAEMDREIEAERKKQEVTHVDEIRSDPLRLTQAEDLNERAMQLSQAEGIDYSDALAKIVRASQSNEVEPSVQEVETFASENGMDFGSALRTILADRQLEAQSFQTDGSRLSDQDYDFRLKEAMEARGYDLGE